jgi:hypothetical protein
VSWPTLGLSKPVVGEAGWNSPDDYIANIGEPAAQTPYIQLTANPDGSFRVSNSRNGFSKEYAVRK